MRGKCHKGFVSPRRGHLRQLSLKQLAVVFASENEGSLENSVLLPEEGELACNSACEQPQVKLVSLYE